MSGQHTCQSQLSKQTWHKTSAQLSRVCRWGRISEGWLASREACRGTFIKEKKNQLLFCTTSSINDIIQCNVIQKRQKPLSPLQLLRRDGAGLACGGRSVQRLPRPPCGPMRLTRFSQNGPGAPLTQGPPEVPPKALAFIVRGFKAWGSDKAGGTGTRPLRHCFWGPFGCGLGPEAQSGVLWFGGGQCLPPRVSVWVWRRAHCWEFETRK